MLYLDLPRVKEVVTEEVTHGRYVALPPSTDPSLLNLSAMGVAPRFKSLRRVVPLKVSRISIGLF
jgi:hypothetical protein